MIKQRRKIMRKYFNETFKITNEKACVKGKCGFKAYNSQGEYVAIVFMTDDKRRVAYGNCEFCFYPKYKQKYGEWHRIISHGGRIKYSTLCEILKKQSSYCIFVD